MKSLFGIEGIIPATPVIYTDASCKTIDFDAVREHFRFLLDHDISALCVGGHAGETECLTMDERLKIIHIALDETKGRIPVLGGIIADLTWSAIEQGNIQKNHRRRRRSGLRSDDPGLGCGLGGRNASRTFLRHR